MTLIEVNIGLVLPYNSIKVIYLFYCLCVVIITDPHDLCFPQPCHNNGVCYNGYDVDSGLHPSNQYTCVCPSGYGGTNCNTQLSRYYRNFQNISCGLYVVFEPTKVTLAFRVELR